MSRSRIITNVALTVAFAIVCLVGLGYFAGGMGMAVPGESGYEVDAVFASANGLVPQSEVRIAGVRVGRVLDVASTSDGKTLVKMTLDSTVHVRSDVRALIRPKSPLGEKFVELIRDGNSTAGYVSNGATIPVSQTGQAVELDDALSNMDPQTREAMKTSLRELGVAVDGQATNVNASLPQVRDTAKNLRPLAQIGQNRQQELDRILTDLNTIMQALADEHVALGQIINSGDQTMSAVAARDNDLAGVLQQLAILFTSLDQVFADLTPADRASLQKAPASLAAQRRMVGLTGPNVDQLIPEILLGEVNYPNNELSVTHPSSSGLASAFTSNFFQVEAPATAPGDAHALRVASSIDLAAAVCTKLPTLPICTHGAANPVTSQPSVGVLSSADISHPGVRGDLFDFMTAVPQQ